MDSPDEEPPPLRSARSNRTDDLIEETNEAILFRATPSARKVMSAYEHRPSPAIVSSPSDEVWSRVEPELASLGSTSAAGSADYDRYYWKSVHNAHTVRKLCRYFTGIDMDGHQSASEDGMFRAKSMPSLGNGGQKWRPSREWGLSNKQRTVIELRRQYESKDSSGRARSCSNLRDAVRPAHSALGNVGSSLDKEPRVRRHTASKQLHLTHDRRSRTDSSSTVSYSSRTPVSSITAMEKKIRDAKTQRRDENGVASLVHSPEWMVRAAEMKERREERERQRLAAFDSQLRKNLSSDRTDAKAAPPAVIESVQATRQHPTTTPKALIPSDDPRRFKFQVEQRSIGGDFEKNRLYFEAVSVKADQELIEQQVQANKFAPSSTMPVTNRTEVAIERTERAVRTYAIPREETDHRQKIPPSRSPTRAVVTVRCNPKTALLPDPEMLNPYGNEKESVNSIYIRLGDVGKKRESQSDSVPQPPSPPPDATFTLTKERYERHADGVYKYIKPSSSMPVSHTHQGCHKVDKDALAMHNGERPKCHDHSDYQQKDHLHAQDQQRDYSNVPYQQKEHSSIPYQRPYQQRDQINVSYQQRDHINVPYEQRDQINAPYKMNDTFNATCRLHERTNNIPCRHHGEYECQYQSMGDRYPSNGLPNRPPTWREPSQGPSYRVQEWHDPSYHQHDLSYRTRDWPEGTYRPQNAPRATEVGGHQPWTTDGCVCDPRSNTWRRLDAGLNSLASKQDQSWHPQSHAGLYNGWM